MVNRRISMDLMLMVAKEQRMRQFIFLTPLDMRLVNANTCMIYIHSYLCDLNNSDKARIVIWNWEVMVVEFCVWFMHRSNNANMIYIHSYLCDLNTDVPKWKTFENVSDKARIVIFKLVNNGVEYFFVIWTMNLSIVAPPILSFFSRGQFHRGAKAEKFAKQRSLLSKLFCKAI